MQRFSRFIWWVVGVILVLPVILFVYVMSQRPSARGDLSATAGAEWAERMVLELWALRISFWLAITVLGALLIVGVVRLVRWFARRVRG